MFNFEEWSQEVYKVNDLIEQCKINSEYPSKYETELSQLWEKLFEQKDDQFVGFLKQLLTLTKEEINEKNEKDDLDVIVNQMRKSVLDY